jgi:GTP-binding protein
MAFMGDVTVEAFSSLNKFGLTELEQVLDRWFSDEPVESTSPDVSR